MEKETKLDPFRHTTMDILSTVVQIATIVAGIILAVKGNSAGLLALGAMAGGTKGNLVKDILGKSKVKGPTSILLALAFVLVSTGCGTVNRQFIVDSQAAVMSTASDYLGGCTTVTIAPAFTVDWNKNVAYGGGLFAGCSSEGNMVEFRCVGMQDEETGKVRVKCAPLSLWKLAEDEPIIEEVL